MIQEIGANTVRFGHYPFPTHALDRADELGLVAWAEVPFGIVEPILNAEHVARVDVISEESLGIGGRAGYYDRAGALVDVIQSHLLEVLSLVAMDPLAVLGARDLRDRKAEVLRATRVWADDPVGSSRRARYLAGVIGDRRLPSYVDEDGVDAARGTETFAELVLAVDTWRWTGVPFHVRAGKAMPALRKVIEITFKRSPRVPTGLLGEDRPDRLVIGIDPASSHPTARSSKECSGTTRCCRYVETRPSSRGASSSRSSRRGVRGRCRSPSTWPARLGHGDPPARRWHPDRARVSPRAHRQKPSRPGVAPDPHRCIRRGRGLWCAADAACAQQPAPPR
jgi:hypothetical protein